MARDRAWLHLIVRSRHQCVILHDPRVLPAASGGSSELSRACIANASGPLLSPCGRDLVSALGTQTRRARCSVRAAGISSLDSTLWGRVLKLRPGAGARLLALGWLLTLWGRVLELWCRWRVGLRDDCNQYTVTIAIIGEGSLELQCRWRVGLRADGPECGRR